ncbi:MAG: conserved repeat domain protein, partial [Verrucomicrobiaceae bacterium]|nr:conserved repeat domain protein [Verrucomicrobiaceae bacterium]
MSGDGFPEAVLSGSKTDQDNNVTGTMVDVLVNDGSGSLYGYNSANATTGASPGRIAIGDLTADGKLDVAMVDNATRHLVIFKGRGNGTLGSADDAVFVDRPFRVDTHYTVGAIAIGDVAGSGHNSVLITEHYFGVLPGTQYDDGQKHNVQLWQLFSYDPNDILAGSYPEYLAVGPATTVQGSSNADILIRDFTGDHYPEVIMTSDIDAGIRSLRLNVPLNNQNLMDGAVGFTWNVKTFLAAAHPQRLAAARAGTSATYDLLVASGSKQQLNWLPNVHTTTKTSTAIVVGGASASNDPYGTPDTVGFKYAAYPEDTVVYSISYVNNTNADIVGATIETLLPPAIAVVFADPGSLTTASGTSHYVRWTLNVPANSSGKKTVICKVVPTALGGTLIAPTASFKKGTTVLASSIMPKVAVQQALNLRVKPSSTSDALGETAHKDEVITYTLTLGNSGYRGFDTVSIGTTFPAGTKYVAGSVGGVVTTAAGTLTPKIRGTVGKETGCDWVLTNMPANISTQFTFQVTVTGADNTSITENTAVVTLGTVKITAAPVVTKILPPLGIYISSTILPAGNQTAARPGDTIRYDVTVHNYSSTTATNVIFADMVPAGMRLLNFYIQSNGSLDFTNGNGDLLNDSYTTTTNPSYDKATKVMGWKWDNIPSHGERSIRFECQVLLDAPFFAQGSKTIPNNVSNTTYNAVGTFGSVKSFSAVPTAGVAVASKATATTAQLLTSTMAVIKTDLTGTNAPPLPKLTLKKFVSDPDGILQVGSDLRFTVINDAADPQDGLFHYAQAIHNGSGAGTATGVVLHEFIPATVTFRGSIARDGTNVPSYFGFHFYNAAGVELPNALTATTTLLVKSFTMPIGDLAANANVVITYQVGTTAAAGGTIVSNSGAVTGKSGLYTFDVPTGYCLTATNMNFPTVGSPKQLTVNVIAPAAFNFPAKILHTTP